MHLNLFRRRGSASSLLVDHQNYIGSAQRAPVVGRQLLPINGDIIGALFKATLRAVRRRPARRRRWLNGGQVKGERGLDHEEERAQKEEQSHPETKEETTVAFGESLLAADGNLEPIRIYAHSGLVEAGAVMDPPPAGLRH